MLYIAKHPDKFNAGYRKGIYDVKESTSNM